MSSEPQKYPIPIEDLLSLAESSFLYLDFKKNPTLQALGFLMLSKPVVLEWLYGSEYYRVLIRFFRALHDHIAMSLSLNAGSSATFERGMLIGGPGKVVSGPLTSFERLWKATVYPMMPVINDPDRYSAWSRTELHPDEILERRAIIFLMNEGLAVQIPKHLLRDGYSNKVYRVVPKDIEIPDDVRVVESYPLLTIAEVLPEDPRAGFYGCVSRGENTIRDTDLMADGFVDQSDSYLALEEEPSFQSVKLEDMDREFQGFLRATDLDALHFVSCSTRNFFFMGGRPAQVVVHVFREHPFGFYYLDPGDTMAGKVKESCSAQEGYSSYLRDID